MAVQGWPWFSPRQLKLRAGKHAPPAHWPSSPCSASSRAPQPSVATRARSAATTSAGASARSRNTCQRMAGSESSSQSSTAGSGAFTSASPRCLDGGDVDLLHRHHRLEGTLCLVATRRQRIG